MTGGYPKFEKRGNKEMLIFRAPRFTKSIVFDPVTTLGDELGEDDDDDDDGDDKDEKNLASSIQLNSFMFVAMVTAVFAFMWRYCYYFGQAFVVHDNNAVALDFLRFLEHPEKC